MKIIISSNSSSPIYEQIASQIKELVISSVLKSGDPLPSVRGLAKSLYISVMTVQRAYDDLQKEGYLITTAGKGTYVALISNQLIDGESEKKMEEKIVELVKISKQKKITYEELIKKILNYYGKDD